jgi:hypothetical protein
MSDRGHITLKRCSVLLASLLLAGCMGKAAPEETPGLTSTRSAITGASGQRPLALGLLGDNQTFLYTPDSPNAFPPIGSFAFGDALAAGDLNHDGQAEIVRGLAGSGALILSQTGESLSFSSLGIQQSFIPFNQGGAIAIGDVNGDGFGDIVSAASGSNGSPGQVFVTVTNNATPITTVTNESSFPFPPGAALVVCDFDGDHVDDIIVAPTFLMYSGATGTIAPLPGAPFAFNAGFDKVACADLNNDGFADLIIAHPEGGGLGDYQVVSAPSQAPVTFFTDANRPPLGSEDEVAAGDLDGDGFAEFIVGRSAPLAPVPQVLFFSAPGKTPPLAPSFVSFGVGDKLAVPNGRPIDATTTTVPVPYVLQFILYQPPGDKSQIAYGTSNAIGTKTTTTLSIKESGGVSISPVTVPGGASTPGVGASVTTTQTTSQAVSTTKTSGTTITMQVADGNDDPDHGQDQFWVIMGALAFVTDLHDGHPPNVTIDYSQGLLDRWSAVQLEEIKQKPQDYTAADLSTALFPDPDRRTRAAAAFRPSDAEQLLARDPFFTPDPAGAVQDTTRFEPAIPPQFQFFGPDFKGESLDIVGHNYTAATGTESSHGLSVEQQFSITIPFTGFNANASITYGYQTVTTDSTTDSLTANIALGSDHVCTNGTVDLFLDKAFGTFLAIPHLSNPCQQMPMQMMSFESLADWQVQGAGSATLSDQAVNGAQSLSVSAAGWTPIVGTNVSSTLLRGAAKSTNLAAVSFALNIPPNQPNQFWTGAAQMYISAPSANVFNAYMGQVELTSLPQGQFVRVGFTIPDYALHALTEDHPDVSFTIVLNVNPSVSGWLIDDLQIGG